MKRVERKHAHNRAHHRNTYAIDEISAILEDCLILDMEERMLHLGGPRMLMQAHQRLQQFYLKRWESFKTTFEFIQRAADATYNPLQAQAAYNILYYTAAQHLGTSVLFIRFLDKEVLRQWPDYPINYSQEYRAAIEEARALEKQNKLNKKRLSVVAQEHRTFHPEHEMLLFSQYN